MQEEMRALIEAPLANATKTNLPKGRKAIARELTPMSLPCIGRYFGKRDHTTVMHAIKTVERLTATDPEFAADVAVLREELAG